MATNEAEKKTGVVIAAILGELSRLGHVAMRGESKPYRTRPGPCVEFDDGIHVEVAVEQRGEKHRLIVGNYIDDPGRKNFAEPKGGFRIGEVAVLVWQLAEARRAKKAAKSREQRAMEAARDINDALGIDGDGVIADICAATDGAGNLVLKANAHGIAEQITAMLKLAIELGLVTSSKPALTRRTPTRDEEPAPRAKIAKAIGVEAGQVELVWDGPLLRHIQISPRDNVSCCARGLYAPEIAALRKVGIHAGDTGWEVEGDL